MRFDICSYTDIGGRECNEDSIRCGDTAYGNLSVLADGLGGHNCGEVASGLTVNSIYNYLEEAVSESLLSDALDKANELVVRNAEGSGMASTAAVLCIKNNVAFIGNAGDSRIYQFRDGEIIFQSSDHSVAAIAIKSGIFKKGDVRKSSARNTLTRCIGMGDGFDSDVTTSECRPGDAFLLCSDGFWELIYEDEMIEQLKRSSNAEEWMNNMTGIVKSRLSEQSDNNSAITLIIN